MATFCIDIPEMAVDIPGIGSVQWYYPAGGVLLLLFLIIVIILIRRRRRKKPAEVEEKKPEFASTEEHKKEVEKFNVVEGEDTVEDKLQKYEKQDEVFAEEPAEKI